MDARARVGARRCVGLRRQGARARAALINYGEKLSFNQICGAWTSERGYRPSTAQLHDPHQVQVGGGVSQVASTVFVAALLSGLTPVERFRNAAPVDYIVLGQDAAVVAGAKDLKVRNDSDQPVRLRIAVVDSTLTARFEAADPLRETFELVTDEHETPADSAAGSQPGKEIDVYRVRKSHNREVERKHVYRDVYPPPRPREERAGAKP
jgi:vancomycin resistance protein YoaR